MGADIGAEFYLGPQASCRQRKISVNHCLDKRFLIVCVCPVFRQKIHLRRHELHKLSPMAVQEKIYFISGIVYALKKAYKAGLRTAYFKVMNGYENPLLHLIPFFGTNLIFPAI